MPVVSLRPAQPQQGKGLTKPKSKIRLRLGLTPPHPTAPKHESLVPSLPVSTTVTHKVAVIPPFKPKRNANAHGNGLATSTSTNRTSTTISRTDSRSAFTYDNETSPSIISNGRDDYDYGQDHSHGNGYGDTPSPPFEDISLSTHSPPMMYPENNISRSSIQSNATGMDPNLAHHVVQHYYPTPERTEPEVEDDAGILRHPHLTALAHSSDDIFLMTDRMLGERFSFSHEIGFGNWGSVWVGKPRHYRASTLEKRIPGGRMGRMAAANGGYGAGGKVAFKLIYREKTAVSVAIGFGGGGSELMER